jgi:ribonuclease Y
MAGLPLGAIDLGLAEIIVIGVAVLMVGAVLALVIRGLLAKQRGSKAINDAETIIARAKDDAGRIVKEAALEAKAEFLKRREEFEKQTAQTQRELRDLTKRLSKREDGIERKMDNLSHKERLLEQGQKRLASKEGSLQGREKQVAETLAQQRTQLLKIMGLNEDQARKMLMGKLEEELTKESAAMIEQKVSEAKEQARGKSREIVINAIQRYAAEHTAEATVSTVDIASDDMKGRVIGREGRNIRAFERATGVDVIVDDTPGVVVVSCFDPVRREIARESLERLIHDGRIHPGRIEELVVQVKKEMDEKIQEAGKQAAMEANIQKLHPKEIALLGRLSYRTSFGQNVLRHSMEVAYLTEMMAEELGLDGRLARRCGLLHDIGKAADHEIEGTHPEIGLSLAKRYNEPEEVLNAIAGHHGDVAATSFYTPLVAAADAVSASRPGARRESLERYIKRLEKLEGLANGFRGIKQAYAIQAGREVRVLADAAQIDDAEAMKTARQIAEKIEHEMQYPGEIRVTLMREVRCVEYAR